MQVQGKAVGDGPEALWAAPEAVRVGRPERNVHRGIGQGRGFFKVGGGRPRRLDRATPSCLCLTPPSLLNLSRRHRLRRPPLESPSSHRDRRPPPFSPSLDGDEPHIRGRHGTSPSGARASPRWSNPVRILATPTPCPIQAESPPGQHPLPGMEEMRTRRRRMREGVAPRERSGGSKRKRGRRHRGGEEATEDGVGEPERNEGAGQGANRSTLSVSLSEKNK